VLVTRDQLQTVAGDAAYERGPYSCRSTGAAAITIKSFAFKPTPPTVKAGTKITVTNKDGTTHTLTSDTGKFDAGSIDGGNSASITVKQPGTYQYHCEIHDSMKGTIKVT
jgi:plastocyanin